MKDVKKRSVWIGQPTYTLNVLEKFGLQDAKPVATPVCVSSKLRKSTDDDELVDENLYQSAIGSLQYLSTMTRPDITFCVQCCKIQLKANEGTLGCS
uniref:Reverse transcriptase Ty1/copia-type domain-containing protein n=1 Tax=Amphimedon queenslandica TaxID=400682 RepID=A0A1X7TQ83_AMPQE